MEEKTTDAGPERLTLAARLRLGGTLLAVLVAAVGAAAWAHHASDTGADLPTTPAVTSSPTPSESPSEEADPDTPEPAPTDEPAVPDGDTVEEDYEDTADEGDFCNQQFDQVTRMYSEGQLTDEEFTIQMQEIEDICPYY